MPCTDPKCIKCNPYPYTHHGPAVHGSKLEDYLIAEANMIEAGLLPDREQGEVLPGSVNLREPDQIA